VSLRLFLALDLPAEHRGEIGRRAAALEARLPDARWVRPENLHLTLSFLGATDEARLPELLTALRPAFAGTGSLTLEVAGAGTFPPARPGRVAWIGIRGGPELLALQGEVAAAAAEALGIEPERRPFHPHVTLARPRRPWNRRAGEELAEAFAGRLGEPFTVVDGVLYRSDLAPGGAVYEAVERFPL
jgi:2'-5' RNA ligase